MRQLLILSLSLFLCACAMRYGREINPADVSKIQKGKTTKQEVLALFGKAPFESTSPQGETWAYYFNDLGYVTPIGAVGKEIQSDNLTIIFEGEIVKDFNWNLSKQTGVSKNPLGI